MEQPTPAAPVAEATDARPDGAQESADLFGDTTEQNSVMNDAIRSVALGRGPATTLSTDDTAADAEDSPAKPASREDVTASEAPAPGAEEATRPGRRARAKQRADMTIEELRGENERLQAERETEIERVRAEERTRIVREREQSAEQQAAESRGAAAAREYQRYLQLRDTPDSEMTGDDYSFREQYKEDLRKFPEIQERTAAQINLERQSLQQQHDAWVADQRAQMTRLAVRPGVDRERFTQARTYEQQGDLLYAAGAAQKEAELHDEIEALRAENDDLRRQGLGHARTPTAGGRAGSAPSSANISDSDFFNDMIRRSASGARAGARG